MQKTVITKNVFVSTSHRDAVAYPDPANFSIFLPSPIKGVYGVRVRKFKFVPAPLINKNTNTLAFTIDSASNGSATLDKGDYTVTTLLSAVNTVMDAHGVHFSINPTTNLATCVFSSGSIGSHIYIPGCRLLDILGFPTGLWLYRPGHAPTTPLPNNTVAYENVATAVQQACVAPMSDMILKITDLEAITASDAVTNRATAILCASSHGSVYENVDMLMYPLLQVQHRLQQLKVSIFDVNGDPYDIEGDASFMLEFHCYAETA